MSLSPEPGHTVMLCLDMEIRCLSLWRFTGTPPPAHCCLAWCPEGGGQEASVRDTGVRRGPVGGLVGPLQCRLTPDTLSLRHLTLSPPNDITPPPPPGLLHLPPVVCPLTAAPLDHIDIILHRLIEEEDGRVEPPRLPGDFNGVDTPVCPLTPGWARAS